MPLFQYSLLTYIFLGYNAYVNVLPLPPCEAGLTHISYLNSFAMPLQTLTL